MIRLKNGNDILLFYKKHKWDFVENYSKRTISGFYAWFTLLVQALEESGYKVHVNNYRLAYSNPDYPVGIVGTPKILANWKLQNPAILGPSLYDHPAQNFNLMKDARFQLYILTCEWLKEIFKGAYGDKCVLWNAGISTEKWGDLKANNKSIDLLIYDKIRWGRKSVLPLILRPIMNHLKSLGLRYKVVQYGNITHSEYHVLLSKCEAMIFLCEHETQGMAYQEALASNIPILAWDYGWWTDPISNVYSNNPVPATSVPYFSPQCGETFKMITEFESVFEKFWKQRELYTPRVFIEEEMSLHESAIKYAKYYFGII